MAAACALVIVAYAFSARPGLLEARAPRADATYYNLLVQGFQAGQLNLKMGVPVGFARLADPYDPIANRDYRFSASYPLHDLSSYKGRLYLYFGITPALVLFWPCAALTGQYLLHKTAVVIFCALGFLVGVGLLCAVWRRYFADAGIGAVAAGTLALGLASFTPMFLQRCDVYEVAISCGYAFTMLALAAIWRALHEPGRRGCWLAAASVACGLAVGARPSLLFGAVILLVPVVQAWRERRATRALWLAAIGPIVLIGLGLMLYNALRFGNPLEFGQRYMLAATPEGTVQHFSLKYLWFNFRVYFLEPAHWSGHFPFAHDISAPSLRGRPGWIEHPFGIITNIPLVWLALAVPLGCRNRPVEAGRVLFAFLSAAFLLFGTCALTLCLYFAACLRYELEFVPALVLLAVIGILGLERALAGRPLWRRLARLGWGLLLGFSLVFNLLASFDLHAETLAGLGGFLLERGQVREAIVCLEKALKIRPDDASTQSDLGIAFVQTGQLDEAIAHFRLALPMAPDDAELRYNLGNALLQKGELDEATPHLQAALRIQPGLAEARCALGNALFQKEQLAEAIIQFQKALKLNPDYLEARCNLGSALLRQARFEEALTHFQAALKLDPANAGTRCRLGTALVGLRRFDEAIPELQKALSLNPGLPEAHCYLGVALGSLGRLGDAIAQLQEAIRLKPDYTDAQNNLRVVLAARAAAAIPAPPAPGPITIPR